MTKLKLNFSQDAASILSREELKQVLGGTGSGDKGSIPSCEGYYIECGSNHNRYACFWDVNMNSCYNDYCKGICKK